MPSAIDREPIWAALFERIKTGMAASCVTISRRHTQPPTLADDLQPAAFLVQQRETKAPRPIGTPGKVTLSGFIILYFQVPPPLSETIGSETVFGATLLNQLLQAVDACIPPDNIISGKCTLGGLVEHCWIEGDTDMDDGMYTDQGAAIIPIKILVP